MGAKIEGKLAVLNFAIFAVLDVTLSYTKRHTFDKILKYFVWTHLIKHKKLPV